MIWVWVCGCQSYEFASISQRGSARGLALDGCQSYEFASISQHEQGKQIDAISCQSYEFASISQIKNLKYFCKKFEHVLQTYLIWVVELRKRKEFLLVNVK